VNRRCQEATIHAGGCIGTGLEFSRSVASLRSSAISDKSQGAFGSQPGRHQQKRSAGHRLLVERIKPIGAYSENTAAIGAFRPLMRSHGIGTTMAQPVEPNAHANRLSVISARIQSTLIFKQASFFKTRFLPSHFNVDQDLGGGQYL
jgi:hypothetical protein